MRLFYLKGDSLGERTMNTWTQVYDPFGNIWISARSHLFRLSFFLALAVFRMKGYVAGFITVVLTVLVALFAYKMPFAMAMAQPGTVFVRVMANCLDYHYVRIFI